MHGLHVVYITEICGVTLVLILIEQCLIDRINYEKRGESNAVDVRKFVSTLASYVQRCV